MTHSVYVYCMIKCYSMWKKEIFTICTCIHTYSNKYQTAKSQKESRDATLIPTECLDEFFDRDALKLRRQARYLTVDHTRLSFNHILAQHRWRPSRRGFTAKTGTSRLPQRISHTVLLPGLSCTPQLNYRNAVLVTWPFHAHCCNMGTAINSILCQTGLSRHLQFLTSGHSDAQGWESECPDVKKWRLNPVWLRMPYSSSRMATVVSKS